MFIPIKIKALSQYRLWIKYSDGIEGKVNLSHLAGKGVFSIWNDENTFNKVYINNGSIAWNDEIDLCADALYMKITGKTPEECFPNLKKDAFNARN
ncbi:DUF2442 domain-containing protein [Candidatus Magnetomoraceae bacterium gMMP-15]